jgi:hypothetical protein
MDAMKKFNSYVVETKVLANLIENEKSAEEISDIKQKIESLKSESSELVRISDESRPG